MIDELLPTLQYPCEMHCSSSGRGRTIGESGSRHENGGCDAGSTAAVKPAGLAQPAPALSYGPADTGLCCEPQPSCCPPSLPDAALLLACMLNESQRAAFKKPLVRHISLENMLKMHLQHMSRIAQHRAGLTWSLCSASTHAAALESIVRQLAARTNHWSTTGRMALFTVSECCSFLFPRNRYGSLD